MGLLAKTSKSNLLWAGADIYSAIKHPAADLHIAWKCSTSFQLKLPVAFCKHKYKKTCPHIYSTGVCWRNQTGVEKWQGNVTSCSWMNAQKNVCVCVSVFMSSLNLTLPSNSWAPLHGCQHKMTGPKGQVTESKECLKVVGRGGRCSGHWRGSFSSLLLQTSFNCSTWCSHTLNMHYRNPTEAPFSCSVMGEQGRDSAMKCKNPCRDQDLLKEL